MAYTVLARRYRSQSFDELVGQEAIARTLLNAIDQNRLAHAYLFVGTRGVGKTSMARIFAKALAGGGPDADKAIMTGQDTDVIEIDAASNRGVDEARNLIANSVYRPLRGKYKVYIIDEVHMLTKEAFNALLKTLEEPPEHVKFILCTTESNKVPATIQSRCQRFEFRNLTAAEIAEHLKAVLATESIPAEAAAIHAVARLGNGSMRDALSILDRLVAAVPPGGSITHTLLQELLGLPDRQLIADLAGAIGTGDAANTLQSAESLLSRGLSLDQLVESLVAHFRDLLIINTCGPDTTLLDLDDDSRAAAAAQAGMFDAPSLIHLIALGESVQRLTRLSSTPRALVDAALVRMAMTDRIAEVAAVLSGAAPSAVNRPAPPRPQPVAPPRPAKKV